MTLRGHDLQPDLMDSYLATRIEKLLKRAEQSVLLNFRPAPERCQLLYNNHLRLHSSSGKHPVWAGKRESANSSATAAATAAAAMAMSG